MITLKNENYDKVLNVPDSLNDITPEVLTKLAANVVLPEHRALIALCWKVNFADVLFSKKNNNASAIVVPLCAKVNLSEDTKDNYKWLNVGKKVILTRSAIEMGVHVHIPNAASMNSISDWAREVENAKNPGKNVVNINTLPTGEFILIEFKVVNVGDISGVITSDVLEKDPFAVNE